MSYYGDPKIKYDINHYPERIPSNNLSRNPGARRIEGSRNRSGTSGFAANRIRDQNMLDNKDSQRMGSVGSFGYKSPNNRFNRYKEKGILKPTRNNNTNKQRGIINKLQHFFKRYSLDEYENDTNTEDLQKSINIGGFGKVAESSKTDGTNGFKRLRYDDDIQYPSAPLPVLQALKALQEPPLQPQPQHPIDFHPSNHMQNSSSHYINYYEKELARKDERLRQLEQFRRQLQHEKEELTGKLREKHQQYDLSVSETRQLNQQLIKANELNSNITNKFDQLNQQYELIYQDNDRLRSEVQELHRIEDHYSHDILQLQLQLIDRTYKLKFQQLDHEFTSYQLVRNPQSDSSVSFYSQIDTKLFEYNEYFQKFRQFKTSDALMFRLNLQVITREYDYDTIMELKQLLFKLNDKLVQNFHKKSQKPLTLKLINHLSMIHQLKLNCLQLLQTVDEIVIILADAR